VHRTSCVSITRWISPLLRCEDPRGSLAYDVRMATAKERSGAEAAEAVRVRRLREDARRPLGVNLAETIALSHELIKMADAARRR
jgi:hypothetical protein